MKTRLLIALRILSGALFFIWGGFGYFLFGKTWVDWWLPLLVALLVAVATLFWAGKWAWLTDSADKWLNRTCHLVLVTCLVYGLFLFINYRTAGPESAVECKVTVLERYEKAHRQSHRSGRRYHAHTGRTVKSYYLEVRSGDGKTKRLLVNRETYGRTAAGKEKTLVMQKGCFGLPVVADGL